MGLVKPSIRSRTRAETLRVVEIVARVRNAIYSEYSFLYSKPSSH